MHSTIALCHEKRGSDIIHRDLDKIDDQRRIIKWLAGLGGLCAILLFVAVFLLPRILDKRNSPRKNPRFLVNQDKRERGD